jgi:hypothetical protein
MPGVGAERQGFNGANRGERQTGIEMGKQRTTA